jgi:hypothetical protein
MQKRILWLTVLAAVLLSSGSARGDSDYYVIVGGGRVGTKITSLPYEIKDSGFYFIDRDLSATGNGITVTADHVTIDMMGCSLIHTGDAGASKGIALNSRTNVEIRNGTIRGFWAGIDDSGAGFNHRVTNIRALNPGSGGTGVNIRLMGNNHLVKDCTAANNAYGGIYVGSGKIVGCESYGNGAYGIWLVNDGSIIGCVAMNNDPSHSYPTRYGFTFDGTKNVVLDDNSAAGNGANYPAGGATTVWGVNAGR